MRRILPLTLVFAACIVLAFLGGTWVAHRGASKRASAGEKKILYWVDPMHPAYTSDKPGIAPDCGMQLEPVYEDGMIGGGAGAVPGAVRISPEKRQAIGVVVGKAESAPWSGVVRILGRVVPDEARTFRITAATDIWVRKTFGATTGSIVRKDEPLAAYFTNGYLAAANAYLYALDTQKRHADTANVSRAEAQNLGFQMSQAVANLINMGVSESQVRELGEAGKAGDLVEIRSPSKGFVLSREVSEGQFIPVGEEMYRIADIDQVWILADLFEQEYRYVHAGRTVEVRYQDKSYHARVSRVLPRFDPVSRTFKVRLVMDNPGYIFRPDMFVDVDLPVSLPKSLSVPAGSVVDTGLRKTVFVELKDGSFEPRRVETGWRFGDRVEITRGLAEGERIALSGNFLIDSESRIRLAAAGLPENYVLDPVCGMGVDPGKAGNRSAYQGATHYFCSSGCKSKFDADPESYLAKRAGTGSREGGGAPGRPGPEAAQATARDPVCGMDVDTGAPNAITAEYQGKTLYFCSPMCKETFRKQPAAYASR